MRPLRLFLPILLLLLIVNTSTLATAQPVSSSAIQQKVQSACSFLKSFYNPVLQLVRETPTSHVYHIARDNLLAQKALTNCDDSTTSQNIRQSINTCCNNGTDQMHESLLGDNIPLPIHTSTTFTIANTTTGQLFRNITPAMAGGEYAVLYENHNTTTTFPDCSYADIAAYTYFQLKRGKNQTGAQHQYDCLDQMYDGKGLADEPYKDGTPSEHGIYQTLKTALYIYITRSITGSSFPYYPDPSYLLRAQGPDGGFHTGYDQAGTYAGTQENAETTSIAIITLTNLPPPTFFTFPSFPLWIIYIYAGAIAVGVAIVTVFIFLQHKRTQHLPASRESPIRQDQR